jgi:hypothetical protein
VIVVASAGVLGVAVLAAAHGARRLKAPASGTSAPAVVQDGITQDR